MRSCSVAAVLLLSHICAATPQLKKRFNGPSDPARFTFFDTPSEGVICDADEGPDGETLWYQDFVAATMGYINYKTSEIKEFPIPYSEESPAAFPHDGNTTGLQCVVRTGKDGMVYGGSGIRNQVVQVNPFSDPVKLQIFTPAKQDPVGNLQPFNDAWAANQGVSW